MITTVSLNIETKDQQELAEKCEAIGILVETLTHDEITMLSGVIVERPDVLKKAREIRAEAMTKDVSFLDLVSWLKSFWKLLKGTEPG